MKNLMRKLIYVIIDCALSAVLFLFAAFLVHNGNIPVEASFAIPSQMLLATAMMFLCSLAAGCYNGLWLYIGFSEVLRQLIAAGLAGGLLLVCKYTWLESLSGSNVVIYCLLFFVLSTGVRGITRVQRWIGAVLKSRKQEGKRVVIVGGGATAASLIARMKDHPDDGYSPVACVDNDASKTGLKIGGVTVAGTMEKIEEIASKTLAEEIIIALPNADSDSLRKIYDACQPTGLPVKMFSSGVDITDYLGGNKRALKEVSFESLLFRDAVKRDMDAVADHIRGKTVLVTGGAGSIGSELCRQLLKYGCGHLVIVDFSENGLFEINEELKELYPADKYSLCLASVRDKDRIDEIMTQYRPELVFHAAAHKHVPMMEINPFEAVKNNVKGTENVILSCREHGVKRFLLISTDKAVNPTNVMGATKRVAELLVKMNNSPECEMCAVRFGNVLGSNGSVIPTFRRQIAAGGPVKVTSKEMVRYFMTIPEAVSLVLTAGTLARGGELFVLDMGRPVRIYDMAEDLIRMSGYVPHKDIQIEIIGLRPGEKLFEEIALTDETVDATRYDKIFVIKDKSGEAASFLPAIRKLEEIGEQGSDENGLREALFDISGKAK